MAGNFICQTVPATVSSSQYTVSEGNHLANALGVSIMPDQKTGSDIGFSALGSSYWKNKYINGIWTNTPNLPQCEFIGFTFCLDGSSGDYLMGFTVDDLAKITVNGVVLNQYYYGNSGCTGGTNATQLNLTSHLGYSYFNLYKLPLVSGNNSVKIEIINQGGAAGISFDIAGPYTTGSLNSAAAIYAALDHNILGVPQNYPVITTQADFLGQNFQTGSSSGYTCPPNFVLSNCGGNPPVCNLYCTDPCEGVLAPTILYSNGVLSANRSYVSYQWKLNGVNISGAIGSTFKPLVSGTYTLIATTDAGCTQTSNAIVIDLCTGFNPPTVFLNKSLASVASSYSTYQWKLNGVNITEATGSTYTITQTGAYTVTVTNEFDCSATSDALTIEVGCTDPNATNYDPSASIESGSCTYNPCITQVNAYMCCMINELYCMAQKEDLGIDKLNEMVNLLSPFYIAKEILDNACENCYDSATLNKAFLILQDYAGCGCGQNPTIEPSNVIEGNTSTNGLLSENGDILVPETN